MPRVRRRIYLFYANLFYYDRCGLLDMEFEVSLTRSIFDFVGTQHAILDESQLRTKFGDVISGLGYEYFTITELTGLNGVIKPTNTFGQRHTTWEHHYFKKQYFRHDPCFHDITHKLQLFTWSEAKNSQTTSDIGKRIFDEAREFGMNEGALIPIRSFDGNLSFVTVSGQDVDVSEDAKSCLKIAGLFFSEKYRAIRDKKRNSSRISPLTDRQTEIVTWLAVGKRHDDIADILGISSKTVMRHVEDAKKRLNVVTRDQLTVEAHIRGFIKV